MRCWANTNGEMPSRQQLWLVAARAGTCPRVVQNAMRLAAGLGLLMIQERRRQCNRNGDQPMKAESAPTFRRAVAFPLPTVEEIEAALDELLSRDFQA